MPVIDNTSEAYNQSSSQYWTDELENLRILLFEYNKVIIALASGNHQSYELNTGQSSQRVTRLDLDNLRETKKEIMFQINELEIFLGIRKSIIQVVPNW
jgi:hypothetical protein